MHHVMRSAFGPIVALCWIAGCDPRTGREASEVWRPPAGKADGVAFDEDVWVVRLGEDAAVEADELTLSRPNVEIRPGDVLVSGDGLGLLRRAEQVEVAGDDLVVRTRDAALTELVRNGSFSQRFEPFAQPTAGAQDDDPFRAGFDVDGGYVKFGTTKLVTDGGMEVALTSGHIDFDPSLLLDFTIRDAAIEHFEMEASGFFDAEIGLRLTSTGYHGVSHKTAKLWESPKHVWTGAIGPVPLVVSTWIEVGVEVVANTSGRAEVEVVAGASSWVDMGTRYDAPHWSRSSDNEFTYDYAVPLMVFTGPASAKIGLDAKLKVAFYQVAGPWFALKPAVRARVENGTAGLRWFGDVGMAAKFGGAIYLPGKQEVGFEGTFWDWYHTFAEGTVGGGSNDPAPTDSGTSICAGQSPFQSALVCNGAALDQNIAAVQACIQGGGGASCLTAPEFGGAPLCGDASGGGYTCDANRLFDCLCYAGGMACVDTHCELL